MKEVYDYQVGGSLGSEAPSYVTRRTDRELYRALKAGQFCYVLNSRQMGKSSLRVQMMRKLQIEGTVCVSIDLTGMGKQESPEKWYAGIIQSLVSGCQLNKQIHWRSWWRERRDLLSPPKLLNLFIDEVLLVKVKGKIVIFVDEIDRILSQPFSLDDFFSLIRYFCEQRNTNTDYKRLTWAFLGVATPRDLILDKSHTPFNIGKAIELRGFQLQEVKPLTSGLKNKVDYPEAVMKEILTWTGGQPFLTQKLCQILIRELEINISPSLSSPAQFVESAVMSQLVDNWEANDEPEHLRTIRDRIMRNETKVCRLLSLYQQILERGAIEFDGSNEHKELRLSGLVLQRDGKLIVFNRIYEKVFDRNWLKLQLARLRPYDREIRIWLASKCEDESSLLQGKKLQDALTWSLDKSLGDLDYQYLVASQNLARRQAETSLEIAEKASQLLASARQKAKQEFFHSSINWIYLPTIAFCISLTIVLVRFSGFLQSLELTMLDRFFRWRPLEKNDPRIAIVTIDEEDLARIGQWPIPDRILALAITKIKAQQPRTIGLDIYRDFPVEPGHRDLVNLFKSTPNLFGIEKVIDQKISPPPSLNKDRLGFSDQVLDGDGKVRRALLSIHLSEKDEDVKYSLAVQLALHYLSSDGITLEKQSEKDILGRATFERLEQYDGGYIRTDTGGYQILLNFRGDRDNFTTFSLTEVIDNHVPANSFDDRLVLIGTTAVSIKDFFYTPYSNNWFSSPQLMPGIILQGNITSQIISSALDNRQLLKTWDEQWEWLWILTWAGLGAFLYSQFKSSPKVVFGLLITSGGLLLVCFLAFTIEGWWLPFVPSLISLWGTALSLVYIINRKREKLILDRTLFLLLQICQDDPISGRVALEYLKRSETKENQISIEEQLKNQFP